jgi:transcriptional regulator with XRE-family HTH domain
MTGLAASTLSQYFSGKIEPGIAQCERIADALGVALSELFKENEETVSNNETPKKLVIERRKISEELREAILETAHLGAAAAMEDVKKAIKELADEKTGKKKRGA